MATVLLYEEKTIYLVNIKWSLANTHHEFSFYCDMIMSNI